MPAIRITAGVASYDNSPRHSFWNIKMPWVKSFTGVPVVSSVVHLSRA